MYRVIENNKDFLLISKNAGEGFHKEKDREGLVSVLKRDLGLKELYTVHRLDTMTSGLLLFAKNNAAAKELSFQFQNRLVEKYYIAISDRRPKKKQGVIKGDMERARRGAWKLTRTHKNPAVTRFFSYSIGRGLRLFVLKPLTGKTHQLRVALKSIGSPVLGDPVYHKKEAEGEVPDRGYLHSYSISFSLQGKSYRFVHMPEHGILFADELFKEVFKRCKRPWELNWPSGN